jgi:hypothetical protein
MVRRLGVEGCKAAEAHLVSKRRSRYRHIECRTSDKEVINTLLLPAQRAQMTSNAVFATATLLRFASLESYLRGVCILRRPNR